MPSSTASIDRPAVKATLVAQRDQLAARIDELKSRSLAENSSDIVDRGAAEAIANEARTSLAAASHRLTEIDRAIAAVAADTYGTCSGCAAPIGEARLEARPLSTTCVACA